MLKYRTWVEISEKAVKHNISELQNLLSPKVRFCAVVKANAYGHGQKEIVNIASRVGVDAFAVDSLDDALELRKRLPSALIFILGYTLKNRLYEVVEANLHATVYDHESICLLEEAATKLAKAAYANLKLETGTNRQGVREEDLVGILETFKNSPHVKLDGVSTHYANIEDTTDPSYATMQYAKYGQMVDIIFEHGFEPNHLHTACSAAIILYPDTHGTLARAGISMYGIWSSDQVEQTARRHSVHCDLESVLSWKTRIAQIKHVPAGEPIGYGLSERVSRDCRIAVLPVGYWDGYDRKLSGIGYVLVKGQRCKIVGRICMNMCMIDVSSVPNIEVEEEVILLGRAGRFSIRAKEFASWCETIPYEVVTRINPQIPRIVV